VLAAVGAEGEEVGMSFFSSPAAAPSDATTLDGVAIYQWKCCDEERRNKTTFAPPNHSLPLENKNDEREKRSNSHILLFLTCH
jgi:hypothetical protein